LIDWLLFQTKEALHSFPGGGRSIIRNGAGRRWEEGGSEIEKEATEKEEIQTHHLLVSV